MLVPKKNEKWRICIYYRELKKANKKDHFPLTFIDQVLDGLERKKLFSFLDRFSGHNQIQIRGLGWDPNMPSPLKTSLVLKAEVAKTAKE